MASCTQAQRKQSATQCSLAAECMATRGGSGEGGGLQGGGQGRKGRLGRWLSPRARSRLHVLVKAAVGQEAHCHLWANGVVSAVIRPVKDELSTTSGHAHGSFVATESPRFLTLLPHQGQ